MKRASYNKKKSIQRRQNKDGSNVSSKVTTLKKYNESNSSRKLIKIGLYLFMSICLVHTITSSIPFSDERGTWVMVKITEEIKVISISIVSFFSPF